MNMERKSLFVFITFVLFSSLLHDPVFAAKKSYIVYLGSHSHGVDDATLEDFDRATDSHHELLASFVGSREKAKDSMIYSYTKAINGFAVHLEEEEAQAIANHPEVVTVFENKFKKLHTTHSWAFVNLQANDGKIPRESLFDKAKFGEDTIIANIDSGAWPESKSFSDEGYGPVPSRWRGFCENNTKEQVPCNRKLIGARYFNHGAHAIDPKSFRNNTARDFDGHGSHTLSTAGGNFVPGVNFFGYANGTAKGGSPKARVAAYKACAMDTCADADILAAFDNAIYDGVNVISVSLGAEFQFLTPSTYLDDGIALGSLHAVQRGIIVSCSAGNAGPTPATVVNIVPWVITVAASSQDRQFTSSLTLGNNKTIKGVSLQTKELPQNKLYPLINAAEAAARNASRRDAELCSTAHSLDSAKVKGKIVVCLRGTIARILKGKSVLDAGGAGMIIANDKESGSEIVADPHFLPAIMITYKDSITLYAYLNSSKAPVGTISSVSTVYGVKPSPVMASFSSQGPNYVSPQVLKPDITAPGQQILAAYSEVGSLLEVDGDDRRVAYNLLSGTSMACPHVAGVTGLLKSLHPDWSPAAIRSAILTTARTRDNTGNPIQDSTGAKATPFNYGSGHIRPNRAADPGLVYDATFTDYLNFICALGYKSHNITRLIRKSFTCPSKTVILENLNYPSITAANLNKTLTITRTLKNVGSPGTYKARVEAPFGTTVAVKPNTLKFDKVGDEKTFTITFTSQKAKIGRGFVFGRLIWSDGKHYVRSPLSVNAVA